MSRVVVCGSAGKTPLGGNATFYLQHCLALLDLGLEVLYLEEGGGGWPYDPVTEHPDAGAAYALGWLSATCDSLGVRWAFEAPDGTYHGLGVEEVGRFCDGADLVLNVSVATALREHHMTARARAAVDTDPGISQVRALTDNDHRALLEAHDLLYTYAALVGTEGCRLPGAGLGWRATRPPVHLPWWRPSPPPDAAYTTVMSWRVYEPVVWAGERWGNKDVEFPVIEELPRRTGRPFTVVVGGREAPRERLRSLGWRVESSLPSTRSVVSYRALLEGSRGEVSVAKQMYVRSHSGWFSERSANYLACGRPVVMQDTGYSSLLPCGRGLIAFSSPDEAVAAVEDLERDPAGHSAAARALAEAHFDARLVLGSILSDAGVP